MTRSQTAVLSALLLGATLPACAIRRDPVTMSDKSEWNGKYGVRGSESFDSARSICLRGAQIDDAESITPDSKQEAGFAKCMSEYGWCTKIYPCN